MLRPLLLVALFAATLGGVAPAGRHVSPRRFMRRGQPAFASMLTAAVRMPVGKGATCRVRLAMASGNVSEGGDGSGNPSVTRSPKFECVRKCIDMLRGGAGPREYSECLGNCRVQL
jgi:hypothetical protein